MIEWQTYGGMFHSLWATANQHMMQVRLTSDGRWRWVVFHHSQAMGEDALADGVAADEESAKACAIAAAALLNPLDGV